MSRAARAFISGPAAKLIFALKPNLLLKPLSSSARPFRPPKVCAPATKTISSPSFFAAAMSWCPGAAALRREVPRIANTIKSNANQQAFIFLQLRWIDFVFARHQANDFVFPGISDNAHGILPFLHRFDALLE